MNLEIHVYDYKTGIKYYGNFKNIGFYYWDEVYVLCFTISQRTKNAIAATAIGIVAR